MYNKANRIFIASELRCYIYKNEYYLPSEVYFIYKRYSDAFGKVVLCSRFGNVDKLGKGLKKVDFIEDVIPIESLMKSLMGGYNRKITEKIKTCYLVIGRVPSITAYRASDIAKKIHVPFLAELLGGGWNCFWNHGLVGKIIAPYMHLKMKHVTYDADYAVYVTEKYLQVKYPCKNESVHASNVLIKSVDDKVLTNRLLKIKTMSNHIKKISVMTTAQIDVLAKGQRFVVRAMGKLKKKGIIVKYYLAGGGKKDRLITESKKAGVSDQMIFLGELTLDEVYHYLDNIDIYIQPTLAEGLPRAVIEAMSRACPCIGANIGGIPELLDEECIVKPRSDSDIAKTIEEMITNGSALETYALHNFKRSKEYLDDVLNHRRNQYFTMIRNKIQ